MHSDTLATLEPSVYKEIKSLQFKKKVIDSHQVPSNLG